MLQTSILTLIFILQYATAITPYFTNYWKTTDATDKVVDYWNHGPIYIPGLQDVFTLTTKSRENIFPPWLTRSTETTTLTEPSIFTTTRPITTTIKTETVATTVNSTTVNSTIVNSITTNNTFDKNTTESTTTHQKPTIEDATDPFSVFLRNLFKSLTSKSLPELPALIEPIISYVDKLLQGNELQWFGANIVYIKKLVKNLKKYLITSPEIIHSNCFQIFNMLFNQDTLEPDIVNLLNTLDDIYTEAEEEDMQILLADVERFPIAIKSAEEIAKDLVDKLILAPMKRISGTPKGNVLLLMLKSTLEDRGLLLRRYLKNEHLLKKPFKNGGAESIYLITRDIQNVTRHKRDKIQTDTLSSHTGMYQTVRSNIERIHQMLRNVGVYSSETSEYELNEDRVEKETVKKENKNLHSFRRDIEDKSSYESDYETLLINNDNESSNQTHKTTSNNVYNYFEKYSITPKLNDNKVLRSKIEERITKRNLVPGWALLTNLIKNDLMGNEYSEVTADNKIPSRNTDFKEDKNKTITRPVKDLSHLSKKYTYNVQVFKTVPDQKKTMSYVKSTSNRTRVKYTESTLLTNPPMTRKNLLIPRQSTTKHSFKITIKAKVKNANKNVTPKVKSNKHFSIVRGNSNEPDASVWSSGNDSNVKGKPNKESDVSSSDGPSRSSAQRKLERAKNKKHHRQSRNRHGRHRCKKRKRGRKQSHKKRKYESLKRKYKKLMGILTQQRISNYSEKPEKTNDNIDIKAKLKHQNFTPLINNFKHEVKNDKVSNVIAGRNGIRFISPPTKAVTKNVKINMFLDDYDSNVKYNTGKQTASIDEGKQNNYNKGKQKYSKQQKTPVYNYTPSIIRKVFQEKTSDKVLETIEYSDAEKELKNNMFDALRHMDFHNVSKSYHGTTLMVRRDSQETDVEAVLKRNIYKSIKKLLNK